MKNNPLISSQPHTWHWCAQPFLLCCIIGRYYSISIFLCTKISPFNQICLLPVIQALQQDVYWGKLGMGMSLLFRKTSSFWFKKYHKSLGGSSATLIRHIRQLTGEYLQRALRLSLALAQEINNSPDRYNPKQIWAMGVEHMKVG